MAERRKFVEVKVPLLKSSLSVLGPAERLNKKTILLDLSRKVRGRSLFLRLRIFYIKGELVALPDKVEIIKSYIRRVVRKHTDYVEDSFKSKCKDVRVVVKPLFVTRRKVSRAIKANLRKTAQGLIKEYISERDFVEVVEDLLSGSFQKFLLPKLKKIYPLSFCDLRVFETKEIEKADIEKYLKGEEFEKFEDSANEGSEELNKKLVEEDDSEDAGSGEA